MFPPHPAVTPPTAGPESNPPLGCITESRLWHSQSPSKQLQAPTGYPTWLMNPRHGTDTVNRNIYLQNRVPSTFLLPLQEECLHSQLGSQLKHSWFKLFIKYTPKKVFSKNKA